MGDDLCVAQVQEWADGLEELSALIGRRFARSEPREHAMAYIRGLLSVDFRSLDVWSCRVGERVE